MTDPAVQAAKRALADMPVLTEYMEQQPALKVLLTEVSEAAAREALKPLRARHKPVPSLLRPGEQSCGGCHRNWPCPDARLIYPEDELR